MPVDEFWQALPLTINEDKWKGLSAEQAEDRPRGSECRRHLVQ